MLKPTRELFKEILGEQHSDIADTFYELCKNSTDESFGACSGLMLHLSALLDNLGNSLQDYAMAADITSQYLQKNKSIDPEDAIHEAIAMGINIGRAFENGEMDENDDDIHEHLGNQDVVEYECNSQHEAVDTDKLMYFEAAYVKPGATIPKATNYIHGTMASPIVLNNIPSTAMVIVPCENEDEAYHLMHHAIQGGAFHKLERRESPPVMLPNIIRLFYTPQQFIQEFCED